MDTKKSQTCSWQARNPVWVWSSNSQESWWFKFPSKSHRFETQEELMFQFDSEGRKRLVSQLKAVRQKEFESPLTFRKISLFVIFKPWTDGRVPSTYTRESNLLYLSMDSTANVIQKHPYRHTQNSIWLNTGHPVALSSWYIKLKITSD